MFLLQVWLQNSPLTCQKMPDSVVHGAKLHARLHHRVIKKNEVKVSKPETLQIHEGTKTPSVTTKEPTDSLRKKTFKRQHEH